MPVYKVLLFYIRQEHASVYFKTASNKQVRNSNQQIVMQNGCYGC